MWTDTPSKRAKIREDIKNNVPTKAIVAKYKVSPNTVVDVRKEMETAPVAYDLMNDSKGALKMLNDIVRDVKKMYDACKAYMTDPEHPDQFDPSPRATDIDVICKRKDKDGHDISTKQSLQSIIDELHDYGYYIPTTKVNTTEPWKRINELANTITKQLEVIAKIQGQIKDVSINIINTEVWATMQNIILDAVSEHPEVRDELSKRLTEIGRGE